MNRKQRFILSILLMCIPVIVNITHAKVTISVDCPGPGCPGNKPDINNDNQVPTVEELANILFNVRGLERVTTVKVRSITFGNKTGQAESIIINFSLDSFDLSATSKKILDVLGQLMISELKPHSYLIVGHANSLGTSAYNNQISQQRAETVKHYLITNFDIEPDRLYTSGKGEDEPLDPENPDSSQNQRVQIEALFYSRKSDRERR